MDTPPAPRLPALDPVRLGASSGATVGMHFDSATGSCRIEWRDARGAPAAAVLSPAALPPGRPLAAPPPPSAPRELSDGFWAHAPHPTGWVGVRSGRRAPDRAPRFPSASVVVCHLRDGAWHDVAFADEPPEVEIAAAALAVAPTEAVIAYLVRLSPTECECRVVRCPFRGETPASRWRRLPSYPHEPGMAGLMAGSHRGALIAAGGANFPHQPPWEGGRKEFYDTVYVLAPGASQWRAAGRLPQPRAYGATVSLPDGILIAGGEDADRVYDDCLLLRWTGETVEITPAPRLPAAITSAAGAQVDGAVYLAGGYGPGTPRRSQHVFWRLPLETADARWEMLPAWPGPPRALAVAGGLGGAFYLVSGLDAGAAAGTPPVYLQDAYRYRPAAGWERLPDLPWSALAAASPAPTAADPARLFVLGGVDGRHAGKLPRSTPLPDDILYFDVARHAWGLWPEAWPTPVVCVPAVPLGPAWVLVSGELMPGKRTTAVWAWQPGAKEGGIG